MGEDYLVRIEGGVSHIGTCVMAQPYRKDGTVHATLSVLNRISHKDDLVASLYAKALCEKTERCVVCVCGIHYNDYNEQTLQQVMDWVQTDLQQCLKSVEPAHSAP